MILIKIALTLVISLGILLVPAIIAYAAAEMYVYKTDMSAWKAFTTSLKEANPFAYFWWIVYTLFALGCLNLLWS